MFRHALRALLIAVMFGLSTAAAAESAIISIDVRQTEDVYVVDMVLWLPVPRELAFDVLVDFEHMPNWVPNLRASRVLTREASRATVEYQGAVPFGFLRIPFTTVRETEFTRPVWIHTMETKGTMKRHESRIDLAAEETGTRLKYHVEMAPAGIAAMLVSKRRVELEMRQFFEAIAAEILRRNAPAPAAQRAGNARTCSANRGSVRRSPSA